MATGSSINISSNAREIKFTVISEPMPPDVTIKCTTTATSFMVADGDSVKITENANTESRTGSISITATTTGDSAYDGIASATSSYTVTQDAYVPPVTYYNVYIERPDDISFRNEIYKDDRNFTCNFGAWVVVIIGGEVYKLNGRGQTYMVKGYWGGDIWGAQISFKEEGSFSEPFKLEYDSKYVGKVQIGYCIKINELISNAHNILLKTSSLSIKDNYERPIVIGEEMFFVKDITMPSNGGTIYDIGNDKVVFELT